LPTTLEPTADLLQRRAAKAGRKVEVVSRLCSGAFDALMGGDPAKHDVMVADGLRGLAEQVELIVLAQASMARVVDTLPPESRKIPILSSPPLAIQFLATVL